MIRDRQNRPALLHKSLEPSEDGLFTTHFFKKLMEGCGGKPATCTVTGYCRTFIFAFPGQSFAAEPPVDHQVICSHGGFTASLVSNLPAYFEQETPPSPYYSINVSLRDSVRRIYEEALKQSNQLDPPEAPLFIVIEEYAEVPPTVLNSGECFLIDEWRNGEAIILGGREGKQALIVWPTSDGAWPDFHPDMHGVNRVLAAVKVSKNFTRPIEELYHGDCFVSSEGQGVGIQPPATSSVGVQVRSLPHPPDLQEKADRIRVLLQGMMSESEPALLELLDAVLLDETEDDRYLRLWYLRLWEALKDAGKHLGYPQLDNIREVIAGKRTPEELREYRR